MGRGCGFFGGGKWSSYGEYFRDKDKKTHRQFHASLQNRSRQQPCYASSSHSPELSRQGRFSPDGEEERDLPSVLNRTLQLVSPQDTSTPPPRKDNSLTFTTTPNNVGCAALCSSFSSSSSSSSFACPLDRIPGLHAAVSRSSSSPRDGDSRTGAGDEGGYGRTVVARRVRDILLSIHEGRLNLKQDNSKGNGSGGLCTPFSNRSLFKNCVFYIDGDTLGIDDVCFKKLLLFFGGRICMLFGKGCTHVIAENLALGNQRWRQLRYASGFLRPFPRRYQMPLLICFLSKKCLDLSYCAVLIVVSPLLHRPGAILSSLIVRFYRGHLGPITSKSDPERTLDFFFLRLL